MAENGSKRSGSLQKAAERVEAFLEVQHVWIALIAALGLALLQIPGVETVMNELGLYNSSQLQIAVAAIVLGSILLELRQLRRRVTPLSSGRKQFPDPGEMYEALTERAKSITEPEHREIEVLGLTLYSAWNQLSTFLERPEVNNWTVKLAVMSHDEIYQRPWIPEGWPEEAATTVNRIRDFCEKLGAEHNHTIEVFEYEFAPAVHGFRLGNNDVFVSTLLWLPEGHLGKHRFSYDFVPARDFSPGADASRKLFENWFDRALRSAAEASARDAGDPDGACPEEAVG